MIGNDNIDQRGSTSDNENYERKVNIYALYIPILFSMISNEDQ